MTNQVNRDRTKLSDKEATFIGYLRQGLSPIDAYKATYPRLTIQAAEGRLPSYLERPCISAAMQSMQETQSLMMGSSDVDSQDKEMMQICRSIAKSHNSTPRERLEAVKTYATIRSKLGSTAPGPSNDNPPASLSGALDDMRQDRFTVIDKAPGMGVDLND